MIFKQQNQLLIQTFCRMSSDSDSEIFNKQEVQRLVQKLMKKKKIPYHNQQNNTEKIESNNDRNDLIQNNDQSNPFKDDKRQRDRSRSRSRQKQKIKWHIYDKCQQIKLSRDRFHEKIMHLPIFRKKDQIIEKILKNQVVLVTGDTGCGKSTQVPRLLYQYIRNSSQKGKILCVQPRRIAVLNLYEILRKQIPQDNIVGYQIAMQTRIRPQTKILFMTNGIFLQRLVHSENMFSEFTFIILDEVHQRDIDTDFILLALKRIIRNHPTMRLILMSATIDNELFRYYFAEDHIDRFLEDQNFYKKIIKLEDNVEKKQLIEQDDYQNSQDQYKLYDKLGYQFMKSKRPCPIIKVTQTGKYKREYYYLDTLRYFLKKQFNIKWGSVIFSEKYPNTHRELFQIVNLIIEEVLVRCQRNGFTNQSVLVFLPGLLQIENVGETIERYFSRSKYQNLLQIIFVHSSILNDDIMKKLHRQSRDKLKIILATNIAQSSITVLGVKYVIDFCLSKQVRFDQRSRMENLQLIWASRASCKQRAGRTGRVCDGVIFRLVEKQFYEKKLHEYSTPQIQRTSLDRLILRIKMIHQNQKNEQKQVFGDPGEVLGTAIQPPNLKHIDQAIKSLLFCGGLKMQQEQLSLTQLGRFYIDLPIDITYSKMLIMSILFRTFDDIIILVSLLSQNKNAFKRFNIERNYLEYFKFIDNPERCDFLSLIKAYKIKKAEKQHEKKDKWKKNPDVAPRLSIQFDIFGQTQLLKNDLEYRIRKKGLIQKQYKGAEDTQDYLERLKFTLLGGFLNKIIVVNQPTYDDKQQKRAKRMQNNNITINNTLALLNTSVIKKSSADNNAGDQKLIALWRSHIGKNLGFDEKQIKITLTQGLTFMHFKEQRYLNRLLFAKFMQDNKKIISDDKNQIQNISSQRSYIPIPMMLQCIGDIDHMQMGTTFTLLKFQRVTVDNFSQNRSVSVDYGQKKRLMLTNTVMQQSSRLFCRYTSLLPDIPHLDVISYLVFFPFITLQADKKQVKYESLVLKRKTKLKIEYQLTAKEINDANALRKVLKDFFKLETSEKCKQIVPNFGGFQQKISFDVADHFWKALKQFIYRPRTTVIDESRWQQQFFKEQNIQFNQGKLYEQMNIQKNQGQIKDFMNDIKPLFLKDSYFSSQNIDESVFKERSYKYQQWKLHKLKLLRELKDKTLNTNPYLCCGQCNIPLVSLKNVGSLKNNNFYREVYGEISSNILELPFNQMGDFFCSMLMGLFIEKQYKVFGCKNGHYFALRFTRQLHLNITKFSNLKVIYPDGTIQNSKFQQLEINKWFSKNQKSIQRKTNMKIDQYCFVCDEKFNSFKELQFHFQDLLHEQNLKYFMLGLNIQKQFQKEQEGY